MNAKQIKKDIYFVGGIDWTLRNFHGYVTQRGSSYNAYLIIDKKVTLIDTVKHYLTDEMIERISSIIDPAKIDYVVCNHVEMDHSGAMPAIMKLPKNAQVVTSAAGEKGLRQHYKEDWNFKIVNSGDSLSLGKRSLQFLMTPMVHWPDNMVSYMPEEKILFSNDAFGQHIASHERSDSEYPLNIIIEEAQKYYANIVLPYSSQVERTLLDAGKLDIKMIAPSHGIIWEKHIPEILTNYQKWALNKTEKKAVIIFDSMWGSTEMIARAIYNGFDNKGYNLRLFDLKANHISDIMTDIMDASHICVGSPTLNKGILPTVAAFLTYLQGLAPKGRNAIVFGSYGWAQQNVKILESYLTPTFNILDSINVNYIPSDDTLKAITKQIEEKI